MKKVLLLLLFISSNLYAQIPIGQPSDLSACDIGSDGIETFNLTTVESEILNSLNPSEYSIGFYNSLNGAETNMGVIEFPENYVNSTSPEVIYVRVEEIADPTNFEVATFELSVNALPVFSIDDVTICQGSTAILNSGLNGGSYLFEWFISTTPIGASGSSLSVTSSGTYTLVVTNSVTGCSYEDSAVVTVIPNPTASIVNYSLADQWIQIEGTPNAVVTFMYDSFPSTVILNEEGVVTVTLPNNTPNSVVCLIEVTGSSIPSCTVILSSCVALVENPTGIVNIPDANFKSKLIQLGVDTNSDGEIQYSEAALKTGTLNVSSSNITDLTGLEAFVNITGLYCQGNNLTEVDVSHIQGDDFEFSGNPNLQYINMKNGVENSCIVLLGDCCDYICDMFLDLPSLQYICVDENEGTINSDWIWTIPAEINMNSYCSFDAGGNYNTITGSILYDFDTNGCDANDAQPFMKMNINDGTQQGSSFADAEGNYIFYTQEGNFTITPQLENPSLFTVSPVNATVNFSTNNNSVSTNNFCVTANGVVPNAEIVVAPVTPARPGFDAEYKIVYKNTGNQILSGQVYFYYQDAVLDLVSTNVPTSAEATGLLTWNYADLQPFETRSINVTLNVNGPMETPAINNGDELIFNVGTNPINGNEIVFSYFQTVVGSFDPNDIICLEGESEAPSAIGNYLHYIVNFENTGTAPAENVVVKVDIDATKYDVSSLQLLSGSHPVEARVNGNKAEFIFKMINLETNGHGNILLKVKSKSSLNVGETVTKKANIFFDYNFPILTNDANTTFQDLSVEEHLLDNSIIAYPNPSFNVVNVEADTAINSIQVYDIQGRLLRTHLANDIKTSIDISDTANGIYFFKIYSEKGIKVERIIKK